jgi:hypothetical protein
VEINAQMVSNGHVQKGTKEGKEKRRKEDGGPSVRIHRHLLLPIVKFGKLFSQPLISEILKGHQTELAPDFLDDVEIS